MRSLVNLIGSLRIGTQIGCLIVVALFLGQVAVATIFLLRDRGSPPQPPFAAIERLAFAARLVESEPDVSRRESLIAAIRRSDPSLSFLPHAPQPDPSAPEPPGMGRDDRHLFLARLTSDGISEPVVVAKLRDGSAIATRSTRPMSFGSPMLLGTMAFMGSALVLLSVWAARQLTAPLARFANVAELFAANGHNTPLPETGPQEVRQTAKALNEMQSRVSKLIDDRTRMLAAISHDLRTPITRLRLRSEDIERTQLRGAILQDLSTMERLVESTLWVLRGEAKPASLTPTDLPPLVQTVCDNFSDVGQPVGYFGPVHLQVRCEPDQLMRAIENLIDNGIKFGTAVEVRVYRDGSAAVIEIQDDGPGIVESERQRVFEPFYRGDAARSLNERDSFGLGLSIARSIVEQNGGQLELGDCQPTGLVARIRLPTIAIRPDLRYAPEIGF